VPRRVDPDQTSGRPIFVQIRPIFVQILAVGTRIMIVAQARRPSAIHALNRERAEP
jgi:hypothetical protein